jgi:hypothetical protein
MRQIKSSDRFETLYCTPKSGLPTLEPRRIKVKVGWIDRNVVDAPGATGSGIASETNVCFLSVSRRRA